MQDAGYLRSWVDNVTMPALPGVKDVHYIHVWTITSGLNSMRAHLVITDMDDAKTILRAAQSALKERFHLHHITLQIEDERMKAEEEALPI